MCAQNNLFKPKGVNQRSVLIMAGPIKAQQTQERTGLSGFVSVFFYKEKTKRAKTKQKDRLDGRTDTGIG